MNRVDFENMTFDELIAWGYENDEELVSYDALKDFAIGRIEDDSLFLAIHVLEAMEENSAPYYRYDAGMGTMDTPFPVYDKDDLTDYIDEY